MRVLVTGANGFVGRRLCAALLRSDLNVERIAAAVHTDEVDDWSTVRPTALPEEGWAGGEADGRIELVPLDLADVSSVSNAVEIARPDRIVHLAARSSGADTDRNSVFAVNVEGTRSLLEAASRITPFPLALIVSTGYVYGNVDPARPAREEVPVGPLWRYGAYTDSKIEMEVAARAYRALAVIARPFAHTGAGQAPTFALPAFARQIARIELGLEPPEIVVGNLEAERDLLDVRDVVDAYMLMLERAKPGELYNVATGSPRSVRDVVEILRSLSRVPTTIRVDEKRLRPADIACSTGDASLLRNATGWKRNYSESETLTALLDYSREREAIAAGVAATAAVTS